MYLVRDPLPGPAGGGRAVTGILPDPTIRIIVCGNADRGDDGAALVAVATLLPSLSRGLLNKIEVRRCLELRVEDLVDVPPDVWCLILDAVVGAAPGEVVELTLSELVERPEFTPRSSHQLPLEMVLGLARVLRERPIQGSVIGLAGHGFGYGTPLSRVVRGAMPAYCQAIEAELRHLAVHASTPEMHDETSVIATDAGEATIRASRREGRPGSLA